MHLYMANANLALEPAETLSHYKSAADASTSGAVGRAVSAMSLEDNQLLKAVSGYA